MMIVAVDGAAAVVVDAADDGVVNAMCERDDNLRVRPTWLW